MNEQSPRIGPRGSGIVGAHAVDSGYAAALIERLVPRNWRARLREARIAGDDLREFDGAMTAFQEAAAGWRRDQLPKPGGTSAGGNRGPAAEGQRKSALPQSRSWITIGEAAEILDRTPRRVRQLAAERVLYAVKEGGRWMLDEADVARFARLRDGYARRLDEGGNG
jgi:hypothetical protein